MTADMLTQGTATRSAEDIAQAIDFVGGSLSASADEDGTYVTVTVVKKDFALAMDLLSDILLHPVLQEGATPSAPPAGIAHLTVRYSGPDHVADVVLRRLIYGKHPYGLPGSGTPDSLRALGREEVARFHDAYDVPGSTLVSFAGDTEPGEAFAAAEKYLGAAAWPKRESRAAVFPSPAPATGMHIFLVDKPDANQSQIRVGRPGIPGTTQTTYRYM